MNDMNVSGNLNAMNGTHLQAPEQFAFPRIGNEASHRLSVYLKRALDTVISLIALIVLMPMIVMLIALLYAVQGRPIFVGHRRIGKNGVMFPCLKFRTMVPNADEALRRHLSANPSDGAEWAATRKLKNDPRITPLGALLRKSSADEIPQLLNVILGHMSIVGPRPIVSSEAEFYGRHFVDYIRVRPGLTGLWQISGRNDISYNARVELDMRYVREQSIWGDIVIMAKTVPAVLRAHGSY
ncbi:sugar transferase [Neorhizobium galegae]|uniref:sugar transferase n=1 Tax=Neorhizobium galegae TaxID=399 RepID=UPI0006228345|nr:sugar transferase [Neorhizobium galegae]CDZ29652.1 Exopolysaccharide production protein ExoY [Neorhizobium galegae bv. officinalis]KAA9388669.1 sugar transferase [Neorhizobium galegae]KAB1113936.1 sugar transferase [Neorhizobium galegae]MCM2501034.1 sugar transferase [Neorhizobium galegae]MCQ1766722.1 sugar transferase [Neorhizobium galegae]